MTGLHARSTRSALAFGVALPLSATFAWGQATVAAPSPASAAIPATTASPIGVLIDRANYWRLQNRADLALSALHRALLLDPRNADALALSAQLHADSGDRTAAQADLLRLRALQAGDSRIAGIEQALQIGPIDAAGLAQARQLAQQGHPAEAAVRYRELFHGAQPPDSLAAEYYQVLGASDDGWNEARVGLARLINRAPQDTRGQLVYAQLLTHRPATRADGISRLAILANNPATAEPARVAWRQALDWLPVNRNSIPLYQAYLARQSDDTLRQRLKDAEHPQLQPADEAGAARQRGFDALQAKRLGDAETAFKAALSINAMDSDALGGLGLVRQRQGRAAEARDLLERAIAAAPDKAAQWQSALNGVTIGVELSSASALANRGQYAAAAQQLRAVMAQGGDVAGAEAMLADVQARSGDLAGAEASYRAVLGRQPDNATALVGLAAVLTRRGRDSEAETLLARADATGHGQLASHARGQQLRLQAHQAADPEAAVGLLRAAAAAAPSDPWIALDLARALVQRGQAPEGRAAMAALTDGTSPSPDTLQAGALFAMETNRPADAAALAARIPARSRNAAMKRLLAQARFEQEVRQADASPAGRQRLLVLAAAPDPDGARGAAIVKAFAAMGDPTAAREAITTALAATRNPAPAARLAYAAAFLSAGMDADASRLANSVGGAGGLSAEQSASLAKLRSGIAVRISDRLNEAGETADAYDQLAPALRQASTDPDLNLALARLYQTAREPKQALAIAESLLRRDPANLDARRAAVSAAIQTGDLGAADQLVHGGLAASPDDPRAWLMSADLARARGNNRRVLSDLRMAQNLRRQQVGAGVPPGLAPEAGAQTQAVGVSGQNPFRSNGSRNAAPPLRLADGTSLLPASAAGPMVASDSMSDDIECGIAAAQSQLATTFRMGPEFRSRSGSPGLDQLNEVTMPLEVALSPGGIGRMSLKATPTLLSSGTLMDGLANQQHFGSLVFGGTAPESQHAQGVGLSVNYSYRAFSGDIGTSPLGFPVQNLLGGLEVAPEIAEGLRLRLVGEQRAVTDSVLSYAGATDPRTGEIFGGVIRDRGHAQLEMNSGLANFYGGGGYSILSGHDVARNNELEFGAGGSYPIYRTRADEVRVGLDLVYFAYDKNLRYFTLGQGGYFSPQSYFAAVVPVDYTSRQDNLSWSVGASVGVQSYTENSSAVFPTNAGLQAQLVSLADSHTSVTPIVASYPGKSQSGIVGGVRGSIEYQLGPDLHIGGRLRYDKAGDWNEAQGTVFVRYVLNGLK